MKSWTTFFRATALSVLVIFALEAVVWAQDAQEMEGAQQLACSAALSALADNPSGDTLRQARATCPTEAVGIASAAIADARLREGARLARDRLEYGIADNVAEVARVREASMRDASQALQTYANGLTGVERSYTSALAQSMNPDVSATRRTLAVLGAAGLGSSDEASQSLGAVAANLSGASVDLPQSDAAGNASGGCYADFRRQKLMLIRNAGQAMSSASAMSSWPQYEAQLEQDNQVLGHPECAEPLGVASQRSGLSEAARTYICGAQAMSCAVRRLSPSSTIAECQMAADQCLQTNPVPH